MLAVAVDYAVVVAIESAADDYSAIVESCGWDPGPSDRTVHCVVAVAIESAADDDCAIVESCGWDPRLSGRTGLAAEQDVAVVFSPW